MRIDYVRRVAYTHQLAGRGQSQALALQLVERKSAACVNILPAYLNWITAETSKDVNV